MDVKILQPDFTYAQALSELGAKLFAEAYAAGNSPENLKACIESSFSLELQRQELKDPSIHTYMAFDEENTPVAFCQLIESKNVYDFIGDPKAIELSRIFVDKRYIGKGIGKKLLAQCFSKVKELGKKTIWLGVWVFSLSAIEFYKSQGFRKAGSHGFKVGDKIDIDDVMVKSIV